MKKMNAALILAGFALFLAGAFSEVAGEARQAATETPPGWELVFEDDFDRDEIGDDWLVLNGNWEIRDGDLYGHGRIVSARGFPGGDSEGFIRLEFDARTDVRPFAGLPGVIGAVNVCDLSPYIHIQSPEAAEGHPGGSGYIFQFGGFNNTRNRIRRMGVDLADDQDPETLIVPDQVHRIVAENDEGTLRLMVDGEALLEERDPVAIVGEGHDRVGFYFETTGRVLGVRVYAKPLPREQAASEGAGRGDGDLALVENGVALAPIVVFEDAPPFTRQAADELAEYIEKTSGARPEVVEGRPDPVPEPAIWVGYQPLLDELFPDLDFDFQHPEEILIAANDKHLVIAGRDRWNPEHLEQHVRRQTIDGVQLEYGTVNAVYTFLQDHLGVRWLWPGETGTDALSRPTIAFEPFVHRYHPQIRDRGELFRLSRLGDTRGHLNGEWQRFQRLQLDSLDLEAGGGGGWGAWWDRFHESHPEYFALQPDGTRGGGERPYPSRGNIKMCVSNQDLWRQWVADAEERIAANPNHIRRAISASPGDSHHRGHCICENCRAWDHPDAPMQNFTWQGLTQRYVSLTDRHVRFANELARRLKALYPDRDYLVTMYAYGCASREAPVEAIPDDNVVIPIVANFHNRPFAATAVGRDMSHPRDLIAEWGAKAPNIAWRPNLGSGAGWRIGLPNVAPRRAIEDMRHVAENGCIGLHFDLIWEHWATQGPHYYMLGQMAWNPYADGEAILKDYYRRAFGEAAEEMEAYWDLMDETSDQILFAGRDDAEVWDEPFFDRAQEHLERAMETLADEPPIYRERVRYVAAGLEYAWLVMDSREQMRKLRESYGQDTEAAAKARANWERVDEIIEKHPTAVNATYVGTIGGRPRGMRRPLHPDYYDQ